MSRRRAGARRLAFLLAAIASGGAPSGCEVETSEALDSTSEAVRDGALDDGDPAIVAVYLDEVVLCTATLVTPRVVITAAHCLEPITLQGHPVTDLEVRFGSNVFVPDQTRAVADGGPDPHFTLTTMDLEGNPDIGVLRLVEPVDIPPIALPTPDISAALAAPFALRVVGYGVTSAGGMDYGDKRQVTATAKAATTDSLSLLPAAMCEGDSGGPYLFSQGGTEYLIGVHSNGNCETIAVGSRVDVALSDFVLPFIEADCVADGFCLEACTNVVDPDCVCVADGVCDATCPKEVGDPDCVCEADGSCNEDCAAGDDPDCDDGNGETDPAGGDGCDVGGGGRPDAPLGLGWLALATLAALATKRRRAAAR